MIYWTGTDSELAFLYHINYTIQPVSNEQAQTVSCVHTMSVCVLQCVWPHQLQVRLGTCQSGLQAVFSPSVYWVWLWPMAAYRPAGNVDTPHTCEYLLIPGKKNLLSHCTLRERSVSWAKSGVSGRERKQRSASKGRATPQPSQPNPVNAQRRISLGET